MKPFAAPDVAESPGYGQHPDLVPPMPDGRLRGWAWPLLVAALGGVLRFWRLGIPHAVVFDETYYVPDSYSILHHGVEWNHAKKVNPLLLHGDASKILVSPAEYVAHPPLGKVVMAGGQWLFGLTPFGWRFSVAVAGTLAVLMTARIARRMTRSTLLGCAAGLLLALDGLAIVLSRTAILDILVMFWVLAAFGLLVIDRDRYRIRLGDGAKPGFRWLRIAAGLCLGCACATKWNGVWYLPAFAGLTLAWDISAWRASGHPRPGAAGLRTGWLIPLWAIVLPAAAYVASWTGWFATSTGYNRNGAALAGHHTSTLSAWLAYNKSILGFGLGLRVHQTYQSNPLGWLVLQRPISLYYVSPHGCGAANCSQEVLAIGTPLIWWGGTLALLACLAWWLARQDWRAGAVLTGVAAGWLPWIWFALHDGRIEFFYYAIVFDPFLAIAITLCLGMIIGPSRAGPARRVTGAVVSGGYMLAVLANLAYLYPLLAGQIIPYTSWYDRMWFHTWI